MSLQPWTSQFEPPKVLTIGAVRQSSVFFG